MNQTYLDTARLLTQVAPLVFVDNTFALKGGTAINLFIRDMPRLSVDLDLVFPDYSLPRDEALARINEAIRQSGTFCAFQHQWTRPSRTQKCEWQPLCSQTDGVSVGVPFASTLTSQRGLASVTTRSSTT